MSSSAYVSVHITLPFLSNPGPSPFSSSLSSPLPLFFHRGICTDVGVKLPADVW